MKDFIELIKDNAQNYPSRVAVIDGDRKITYKDFFNLVSAISRQLVAKVSKPKVVFDLKQGIESYALIVAVLNVGGTYCPLNQEAPTSRKLQIIKEFAPDFIITENEGDTIGSVTAKETSIMNLLIGENQSVFETNYNGDDIIYVIYTSGSTGVPKGVKICRKALNKFLEWSIPAYGAGEKDIWGQFSFLSFDLSVVDIFTCLCSGATLLAMNDIAAKKNRPAKVIETAKITIWHSVPSATDFMIVNERSHSHDFSSLRLLSFCGEPLQKHQVEFLFKKKEDLIVFNTYGPTEGTLFCTHQELRSFNYLDYCDLTVSIGKAIPGWNLKLNPIEDFIEPEIIIYGNYIGKGYLGIVSDSRFREMQIGNNIVNAFETGDLVRVKDGNLYFAFRKDRQVKIKGFRVELDEVDFRINEFLNKKSITVAKKGSLYSFIESNEEIREPELRAFLKEKLELFKIPNVFYKIQEIPRNQNQKVNTTALIELIP